MSLNVRRVRWGTVKIEVIVCNSANGDTCLSSSVISESKIKSILSDFHGYRFHNI